MWNECSWARWTEWPASIVFAPKRDGLLRFCVDHKEVNVVTENDSYSMLGMKDCINSLSHALIFSTLHTCCSKMQVETEGADSNKNTFTSPLELSWFSWRLFGPLNASMHLGLSNGPLTSFYYQWNGNWLWNILNKSSFSTICGWTYWTCLHCIVVASQSRCLIEIDGV